MTPSLLAIYERLAQRYGPQGWWPGDSVYEVIVGAILTQQTSWANVEKVLANLKASGVLEPAAMRRLSEDELAALIRPSGFYRAKARKLRAFLGLLSSHYDGRLVAMLAAPANELRAQLLATHGIGPETADAILLYAAGRPFFVIDAYTRRTFSRIGIRPATDSYAAWQRLFHEALPRDAALCNEYHALIVEHGKTVCRAEPRCGECALQDLCETGRTAGGGQSAPPQTATETAARTTAAKQASART